MTTCQNIRGIYDEFVLREVVEDNPENKSDGKISLKISVDITSSTQKAIHRGLYPEDKIIESMDKALDYWGNDSIDLLYRVCVFHYLFGYIHYFYDGNGGLNRFISSYTLGKESYLTLGYWLSRAIKENISAYYKAFNVCNQPKNRGDLTPFVKVFLQIIEKSRQQLLDALEEQTNALDYYGTAFVQTDLH